MSKGKIVGMKLGWQSLDLGIGLEVLFSWMIEVALQSSNSIFCNLTHLRYLVMLKSCIHVRKFFLV